jgi:hypothetical protein
MLLQVKSIAFTSVLKCNQNGKSIALPIQHITLGISFLSFYIEKESRIGVKKMPLIKII